MTQIAFTKTTQKTWFWKSNSDFKFMDGLMIKCSRVQISNDNCDDQIRNYNVYSSNKWKTVHGDDKSIFESNQATRSPTFSKDHLIKGGKVFTNHKLWTDTNEIYGLILFT